MHKRTPLIAEWFTVADKLARKSRRTAADTPRSLSHPLTRDPETHSVVCPT